MFPSPARRRQRRAGERLEKGVRSEPAHLRQLVKCIGRRRLDAAEETRVAVMHHRAVGEPQAHAAVRLGLALRTAYPLPCHPQVREEAPVVLEAEEQRLTVPPRKRELPAQALEVAPVRPAENSRAVGLGTRHRRALQPALQVSAGDLHLG